jgi:hypothetical protein
MFKWLSNWLFDRALSKEISATEGLADRVPKVQREANEQYTVGMCTATVMKDAMELKARLFLLEHKSLMRQLSAREAAEKAWLTLGSIDPREIAMMENKTRRSISNCYKCGDQFDSTKGPHCE